MKENTKARSQRAQAKKLFLEGKGVSYIATALSISRATVYAYKKADFEAGVDWDELAYASAIDPEGTRLNEKEFLATLIREFEKALKELDTFNSELNFDSIITSHIFTQNFPPRWVMVINAYQIVLIERAKWAQKRYLRFDIKDIIERKEDNTLKALSILLHKSTIAPTDGLSLLDTLDENSHKHAFGVTEDLKYSLRSAVELLVNEAIYYYQKNAEFCSF